MFITIEWNILVGFIVYLLVSKFLMLHGCFFLSFKYKILAKANQIMKITQQKNILDQNDKQLWRKLFKIPTVLGEGSLQ